MDITPLTHPESPRTEVSASDNVEEENRNRSDEYGVQMLRCIRLLDDVDMRTLPSRTCYVKDCLATLNQEKDGVIAATTCRTLMPCTESAELV